jgi:hypothetical protein
METGRCHFASAGDAAVRETLHPAIGAPAEPSFLLVPLAASGKTVSLIYGDFGPAPAAAPPLDLLETFAAQAAMAFELLLCRRKLAKPLR